MGNKHFGNLADVFKHLALCEALGTLRPAEYWESHAGAALYSGGTDVPPERLHGIGHFLKLVDKNETLRFSCYGRALAGVRNKTPDAFPGSPLLARNVLGDVPRRMLLCDTDEDALQTVQQALSAPDAAGRTLPSDKLECIPDDGTSVLRGAGVLLPEQWGASVLALVDPYDPYSATAAGISPLELTCELGNRGIVTLLSYACHDEPSRHASHQRLHAAVQWARLLNHGSWRFEGALRAVPSAQVPTQWGFGLLALNLSNAAADAMDGKLRALQRAYDVGAPSLGEGLAGDWTYVRTSL